MTQMLRSGRFLLAGGLVLAGAEVAAAQSADLTLSKNDGVVTAFPGGSTVYIITAANFVGPSDAVGATVTDSFPAECTSVSWQCAGSFGGSCTASGTGSISDTVNIPRGGSVSYLATCTISSVATGTLTNTATVTAPAGVTDPSPANNSETDTDTLAPLVDFSVTKTDGVATVSPGGSTTYSLFVSNAGPGEALATVTDTFPAALSCTWTCFGAGSCASSGSGNINNAVGLMAGNSVLFTISCTVSALASGSITNTATVTASDAVDTDQANNSATDVDSVTAAVPTLPRIALLLLGLTAAWTMARRLRRKPV